MNTIELKNILISRITEIDDVSFLEAIKTILDTKANSEKLKLTSLQRDEICMSKIDIEQGRFVEHETFDKEVKKWLSEK